MNNILKAVTGVASLAVGSIVGAVVGKVVLDKKPALKPVVIWASGALIGVGATMLAKDATRTINKSEAASILASNDDTDAS